jgi:ATP-dependent DNA helicase RecG
MKGENKSEKMAHRASAEQLYHDWYEVYGDLVRLSHGGLNKQVNENAINAMKSGDAQILIATTLVEVGITIPKLSYCLVLNPENLGVVTLHQIRGRLSRDGGVGYFDMLPTKALKQPSLDRLNLLVQYADGFTLAEADLALRGMGDLKDGNNQSGTSKCILVDAQLSLPLLNSTLERLTTTVA